MLGVFLLNSYKERLRDMLLLKDVFEKSYLGCKSESLLLFLALEESIFWIWELLDIWIYWSWDILSLRDESRSRDLFLICRNFCCPIFYKFILFIIYYIFGSWNEKVIKYI